MATTTKLLARKGLLGVAVEAAKSTRAAQDKNHQVLLTCASLIIGDDDEARKEGCEAALAFLNVFGPGNATARRVVNWFTTYFRIGIDYDAKAFKQVRFKANSEKADDLAGADAAPYWVVKNTPSEDAEAARPGVAEVRAEFARFLKKMDAINNGNATDAAKKLARKARNFVAEC